MNTIYGRWWHPEDEQPGENPVADSPLPWTGEYEDGLGNLIRMLAYANPQDRKDETQRADGHGIVRFNKKEQTITFECWSRFADVDDGDVAQFPGWPVTIRRSQNDGRTVAGYLPELQFTGSKSPVVKVIRERDGEVLYSVRVQGDRFRPAVYESGKYTIKLGTDRPDQKTMKGVTSGSMTDQRIEQINLP